MNKPRLPPTVDYAFPTEAPTILPAASAAQSMPATPAVSATSTVEGSFPEVPGYEILRQLGRGGMGIVYQARQVRLNRLVALKMILSGAYAEEQDRVRFRGEAEALAELQHPNIVQVHDVGEHNGLPYLVLELCEGGSLNKRLNGQPLSPPEAARLVEVLARGAHAAHERRIVHRDLKPANVLFAADGTPKITDFGLAKRMDDSAGHTPSNAVLGTPSYMAPEQAGSQGKTISPAADVYALGAILYELLTGRPPFQGPTDLDTILQVVSNDPVPPRQLQRLISADLETICLKCLQKEPGRRYATAQALADDLQRLQRGEPIRARPVGRLTRAVRWARRRPAAATLIIVLVLVFAAAVTLSVEVLAWLKRQGERTPAARAPDGKILQPKEQRYALAYSPDGKYLAAAGRGGAITLWAMPEARVVVLLQHNSKMVTSLAFSPDSQRLASASSDGTVKVWETPSGKRTHDLVGHSDAVTCIEFSADGQRLASSSDDRTVKVWDAAKGKELRTFTEHRTKVHCVAFSPDGRRIASGNGRGAMNIYENAVAVGVVKVWDAETGVVQLQLRHDGPVWSLAFNRGGDRLASASADQTVKVWHARTGLPALPLLQHSHGVNAVAFSHDGQRLASVSENEVKLWAAANGTVISTFRRDGDPIANVVFSPDDRYLAYATVTGKVTVYDSSNGAELSPQ